MVGKIVLLCYLIVMSGCDLVRGRISLRLSLVAAVVLLSLRVLQVQQGEVSWVVAFSGIFVGVALLLLTKVTRGAVGAGDGVVFVITGLLFGIWENVVLLCMSLFLLGIVGGILLMIHRVHRKTLIPFVPFVLLVYGGMLVWKFVEWI